jgi:prophage antirepressor-like protein
MNRKKEVFFMEIFNEILKLNDNDIVIIYDKNGDIWFKYKDLLKAIGYESSINQFNIININKKYIISYSKITIPQTTVVSIVLHPNTKFINEAGLYELLSKSTKPLARIFMDRYVESNALHLG